MNSDSIVVMGVAGSGKSSLGAALAQSLGRVLIEGDSHHSDLNRDKMRHGTPLTDADRADWLDRLAALLRAHREDAVLTCSSLRRAYRERLRTAAPNLRFVYLEVSPALALQRVSDRLGHFMPPSLVESQFATLEPPRGEAGVLTLDAASPLPALLERTCAWLARPSAVPPLKATE